MVQDTNGSLYGTTNQGGANACDGVAPGGCGTVLSLGTSLTGATSVTFNGTPAAFTVVSPSYISTTVPAVPAGATTGKVEVATPTGMLTSNVNFCMP